MSHWWSYDVTVNLIFKVRKLCFKPFLITINMLCRKSVGLHFGKHRSHCHQGVLEFVGPAEVLSPYKFTSSTTNTVLASKCNGLMFLLPFLSNYHELLLTAHRLPTEIIADVDLCQGMFHSVCNGTVVSLGVPL